MKRSLTAILLICITVVALQARKHKYPDMKSMEVPSVSGFADIEKFAKTPVAVVDWPESYPYCPEVTAYLAHTEDRLLVRFEVTEDNVKAVTTEANGPVWEDSCCEFFVKVPDSEYYYNFETNCIGTGLAAKRKSRSDFRHFGPEEMAKVTRRSSLPCKPVNIKTPSSWSLELEIPFEVLGCSTCPERLLANIYKCGDKTDKPHFISWNKVGTEKPDFHRPEYFGELILK